MMALSGVRNSWLMVARKRLLSALARSASARASSSACSWCLLSVTSRTRDNLATILVPASTAGCSSGRQRISTQTNCAVGSPFAGRLATDAKLHGSAFAQDRSIAERSQISRPVGDMDPAEQALFLQLADSAAEQRLVQQATRTATRHHGRSG